MKFWWNSLMLGLSLANSYATLRARQLQILAATHWEIKEYPFSCLTRCMTCCTTKNKLSWKSLFNNETQSAAPLPPAGKCWSLSSRSVSQRTEKWRYQQKIITTKSEPCFWLDSVSHKVIWSRHHLRPLSRLLLFEQFYVLLLSHS